MVTHSDAIRLFNSRLDTHKSRLFSAVPQGIDRRQLEKGARRTVGESDELLKCTWESLALAITDAASLGLAIGRGVTANAYLVPFYNKNRGYEAVLVIGYKGMIDLARRSPQCRHIHYDVVREGDVFRIAHTISGSSFEHVPSTDPTAGRKITHAYVGGELQSGGTFLVCMTRDDLEAHGKKYSKKYADPESVWKAAPDVAYMKTVIRQAFSRRKMPMAVTDWRVIEKSIKAEDVIEGSYEYIDEPMPLAAPSGAGESPQTQTALPEPTSEQEPLTVEQEFEQEMAEINRQQ